MITLNDLNHLRSDPRIKFKTEHVDGQEVTIVSYMIADPDLWNKQHALECRGITFDSTGSCISRPLNKFFNIGENAWTQESNLDFNGAHFYEKKDGSMLVPVLINNNVFWKSKKSFFSDVAIRAQEVAPQNVIDLAERLLSQGFTPIFEFTHPEHQIVIDYGRESKFTLIAIREIDTGEYLAYDYAKMICYSSGVDIINRYDFTYDVVKKDFASLTNFEGYVIHHPNGVWTKIKTPWYLLNHRIMTELRERDIAEAVIDEVVDDIKSSVTLQSMCIEPILEIEHRVVVELESIIAASTALYELFKQETSQKDAALKYKNDKFFGLAMILYKGKEPDYKKYWKQNCLKQNYSLKVLYNQTFSKDL